MNDNLEPKLKEFYTKMRLTYQDETLKRGVRRLRRLANLGLDLGNMDIEWIFNYINDELNSGKKKVSIRSEIDDMERWCTFTGQESIKKKLPKIPREDAPEPWFPTQEEYERSIRTCLTLAKMSIRDYLKQKEHERKWFRTGVLIKVLGETGVRVGELVRANLEDVSPDGMYVHSEKKEKDRYVSWSPSTYEALKFYIDKFRQGTDRKALFTADYGRMSTTMIERSVHEAGVAAGVPKLHPHALRHYCATWLLGKEANLRKIQLYLGHKDIQSTTIYTHMMSKKVQVEIGELFKGVQIPDLFQIEGGMA
ncbi:MAG: site-specific integrase [Candidatus Thermoplasmatota archaeon]|nr:site-specific integrase [Candidatus Thermoplasmatota archaeon]